MLNGFGRTDEIERLRSGKRNWGRIVNIASVHGLVASVQKIAYIAAKHGVLGLTKAVALESATSGITCNAICLGWVLTPLVQKRIDDRAARKGIAVERAKTERLLEKQPSLEFATPEQIRANRPSTPHRDKKRWGTAAISSFFRAFALVTAIPVLPLVACTTEQKVSGASDTDIRATETSTLCGSLAHGTSPNAVALDELQRRGEIRAQYVGAIRERRVTIGMNICEVFASIGVPNRLNRTKLPPGTVTRFVYSSGHYVYLDEGDFVTVIEGF